MGLVRFLSGPFSTSSPGKSKYKFLGAIAPIGSMSPSETHIKILGHFQSPHKFFGFDPSNENPGYLNARSSLLWTSTRRKEGSKEEGGI